MKNFNKCAALFICIIMAAGTLCFSFLKSTGITYAEEIQATNEVKKAEVSTASYDGTDYGDTFLPEANVGALTPNSMCAALIEANSGEILYESNADAKRPIASMVKIMTLVLIFDALDAGKFTLNDGIRVSERAFSMGGSQAFLDKNQSYKADDLILSIVIASANDSCVAMAEHLSGSVELFVEEMNKRAESLGMKDTVFVNVTGLPQNGQFSTARDVGIMTRELIKHKEYFKYSKVWMHDLKHPDGRVTGLTNTNKLSRFYEGCDGGKTGFTGEAMHCLSATATRNNMRLISVVLAGKDSKGRFADVSSMLDYGFANYESKKYLSKDNTVAKITVNNSVTKSVELAPKDDLFMFGKKGSVKGEIKYEHPIMLKAPLKKGQEVGKAYLVAENNSVIASTSLVVKSDVEQMKFMDRIKQILKIRK